MDLSSLDSLNSNSDSLDYDSIGIKTHGEVLQDNKTQRTYTISAVSFSIVCCVIIFAIICYVNFYAKPKHKFPYGYTRKYNSSQKN